MVDIDTKSPRLDTPLSNEQLVAPDSTYTIVRCVPSRNNLHSQAEPHVQTAHGQVCRDAQSLDRYAIRCPAPLRPR